MIAIASSNGRIGMQAAIEILRDGGRAVDAVERLVVAAADVVPRHRDVGGVAVGEA